MDHNQNKHIRNPNSEKEMQQDKLAAVKAQKLKQMRTQQMNRMRRRQRTIAYLVSSTVVFLVILIILAILFHIDAGIGNKDQTERNFKIMLNDDSISKIKSDFKNGEHYVALSSLSDIYGYIISGDKNEMAITMNNKKNDNTAAFKVGTDEAVINGISVFLDAPSYLSGEELYIPASFFAKYVSDTSFIQKTKKHTEQATLRIQSKENAEKKPSKTKKGDVKNTEDKTTEKNNIISEKNNYTFKITGNKTTPAVSESGYYGKSVQNYEYKIDITNYEKFINPENKDQYLILINQDHPLTADYVPDSLTDLIFTRKDGRAVQKMQKAAAMSLEAMLKEAAANGFDTLSVTSGYRSYSYQKTLFDNQTASLKGQYGDKAQAKAAESVAVPGTSEHQSGLCADLHNLPEASQTFANTKEYKWLYENCAKFGFILRFPNGKQNVTGIIFEPWHYRFVGRYHAQKIMEQGLTLEEYMQSLKK